MLPARQTVGTLARTEISQVFFFFFWPHITNCFRLRSGGGPPRGSTLQRGAVISGDRLVKGGLCPGCLACPRERAGPNLDSGRPYDRDALPPHGSSAPAGLPAVPSCAPTATPMPAPLPTSSSPSGHSKVAQAPAETSFEGLRFLLRELATDLQKQIRHARLGLPRGLTMMNKRMPNPSANTVLERMCTHATRCAQSRRPHHPLVQETKCECCRHTTLPDAQQCSTPAHAVDCERAAALYDGRPSVNPRPLRSTSILNE